MDGMTINHIVNIDHGSYRTIAIVTIVVLSYIPICSGFNMF